jgi:selenocysteine lyase/cysteine desulfurase
MPSVAHQNYELHNFPQDVKGLPRRKFLGRLLGGGAALAAWPDFWSSGRMGDGLLPGNAPPDLGYLKASVYHGEKTTRSEAYWQLVKDQFMIRDGLVMLNAANLCPSPYPVQQAVFRLTRDIDRDPSSLNRAKFSELRSRSRQAVAELLGADPDEIALTRNTSEGNNIVIGGLNYKAGDEVVIWDENHPTANVAWDVRAERYGFTVKRVKVPSKIYSIEDLIKPFRSAFTDKTRVVCFSHVSNLSGVALPAKEICEMARTHGVLSHVDGAQTFGSHVVDLHDLGCDFYTGSSHKWFCGPKEMGVLYVRKQRIPELWPSIIGVGYPGALKKGAEKFETLGQRDDSRIAAVATTVNFHNTIGKTFIEARVRGLAHELKTQLKKKLPRVVFRTPLEPELSGGPVIFNAPGIDLGKALDVLYHDHNIGGAVFGGDLAGIRLCPHIYNTMEEMERAATAVSGLA